MAQTYYLGDADSKKETIKLQENACKEKNEQQEFEKVTNFVNLISVYQRTRSYIA